MPDPIAPPAEDVPATGAPTPAPPASTPAAPPSPEDLAADLEKWKAMSRKHEEQAKANADKAKRLDALEEASKSETEKLIARAEAAEKAAAEATSKALRADVAAAKGVPAALLSGSTQEELEAAADALLAFKGTTPKAPSADGQGKVGGPVGADQGQLTDADLESMTTDEINKARRAGRLDKVLGKS
jgi:predicted PilT family ATPase